MPIYMFKNTETDEIWEELLSMSDREMFLADNPHIEQVITVPNFVSGIGGVTHKTDGGFKDMLSRIAAANPYTPLGEEHGSKGIKESKIRDSVSRVKGKLGGAVT